MNREQMVEKAAKEITGTTLDKTEGFTYAIDYDEATELAQIMLDAILPQITTAEELKALPDGTKLLDVDGMVWRLDSYLGNRYLMNAHGGQTWRPAEHLPLTVVWQPQP